MIPRQSNQELIFALLGAPLKLDSFGMSGSPLMGSGTIVGRASLRLLFKRLIASCIMHISVVVVCPLLYKPDSFSGFRSWCKMSYSDTFSACFIRQCPTAFHCHDSQLVGIRIVGYDLKALRQFKPTYLFRDTVCLWTFRAFPGADAGHLRLTRPENWLIVGLSITAAILTPG